MINEKNKEHNLKDDILSKGFVLSKNVELSVKDSFNNVCIFGITNSTKFESFISSSFSNIEGNISYVIKDANGKLYKEFKPYLESKGIRVIKFEPFNSKVHEFYYNPLLVAEDDIQIRKLAQLILLNGAISSGNSLSSLGGTYGKRINMMVYLFTASLIYFKEYGRKKTINEAINFLLTENNLNLIKEKFSESKEALNYFKIFEKLYSYEINKHFIDTVFLPNIQLFLDWKIESFTRTPFELDFSTGSLVVDKKKLFDPKLLREIPTVLFICYPKNLLNYLSPLMTVIYSQLLSININYFNENESFPVLYFMNDFLNVGLMPDFIDFINLCKYKKIGICISLESIRDFSNKYGDYNSFSILKNIETKVIFNIDNNLEYFTDLYKSDILNEQIIPIEKALELNKDKIIICLNKSNMFFDEIK